MSKVVAIADLAIGTDQPLALIAGPCVIESRDHTMRLADEIGRACRKLKMPFIFKASFDKANRSSVDSFRGPGLDAGLNILAEIKRELGIPVLSDVHEPHQAEPAAKVLVCIQLPAFLSSQTDLLLAVAGTTIPVNIKKGQHMSPEQMANATEKIRSAGNDAVLLTERGTFFGYNYLVNDFTSLSRMRSFAPVVFDATHSCQLPGSAGHQSGGRPEYIPMLARAAVAVGCDALFLEVHNHPEHAKSDSATVYPVDKLTPLLQACLRIAEAAAT